MAAKIPAFIAYNPIRGRIRIEGPPNEVREAKIQIMDKIADCTVGTAPGNPHGSGKALQAALEGMSLNHVQVTSHKNITRNAEKIFPIKAQEDADMIQLWTQHILPNLCEILEPAIGKNFSICLVREGWDENVSEPCVQVESPHKPSELNRRNIREAIIAIWSSHMPSRPCRVRFLKGGLTLLSDGADSCQQSDNDEDEDDVYEFPHRKRYWHMPGMSAGIGLIGDREVSASIGGHILLDGFRYALLVDHFIERSLLKAPRTFTPESRRVTSPPLSDVDEVRDCLNRSFRDYQAEVYQSGDQYIPLSQLGNETYQQQENIRSLFFNYMALLSEVNKDDEKFIIGDIVWRSGIRGRPFSGSPRVPLNRTPYGDLIRMDWSICKLTEPDRIGVNRYRYPYSLETAEVNYMFDSPLGAGESCTETCELEPNVNVHYLGRQSGLRQGQINGARMLCSTEDPVTHERLVTNEWFLVPRPDETITQDSCAGDSGSFMLRSSDRKVMAQLFSHACGKLLVTPIHDIFRDIKEATGVVVVSLAPDPLPPSESPVSLSGICEVKKSRKARKFKFDSLPPPPSLATALPMISGPPIRGEPPLVSLKDTGRPPSPVPSLISSGSFSQGSEKTSQSPEISRNHSRNASSTLNLPTPIIVEPSEDEAHTYYQEPDPLRDVSPDSYNKASISFILQVKESNHSPTMTKSSTFPQFGIPYKYRTTSLDGCFDTPKGHPQPSVIV